MDTHPPDDIGGGAPKGPADWIDEFRRQCASVQHAAEEWAVRWHEPEGRFIAAMLGAVQTFSGLAISAQAAIEAASRDARASAQIELETARELARSAELALLQARNAQVLHMVESQNVEHRMIKETLPKFIQAMKGALIIRETRWNRRTESVRFSLAGLLLVGVFVGGFAACFWRDQDQVATASRCLATAFSSSGHVYCQLDGVLPQAAAPSGAQ